MTDQKQPDWHQAFISMAFGVLLVVWIEPVAEIVGLGQGKPIWSGHELDWTRGILLFLVLICLWWWYAIFLSQVAPAAGLTMYIADFLALFALAVASRFWNNPNIFSFIVILGSAAIACRFGMAFLKLPLKSREREAILAPLHVLGLVLIGAVIYPTLFFLTISSDIINMQVVEGFVILMMGAGILATVRAAFLTGGWTWGHTAAFLPTPIEKLTCVIVPKPDSTASAKVITPDHIHIGRCLQVASQGRYEFENALQQNSAWKWRDSHLSVVHSYADVDVQAKMLCIPSIGREIGEIRKKSYLAFLAHWLDDLCDRQFIKHISQFVDKHDRAPTVWDIFDAGEIEAARPLVARLLKDLPAGSSEDYINVGFQRIFLGSLIFSKDKLAHTAIDIHSKLLQEKLGDKKNILDRFDRRMTDLTAKSVLEIWMGLEPPILDFRFTYLYSLLYAPALYFHDHVEETNRGEITGDWSTPNVHVIEKHLEAVGEALVEAHKTITDDRLLLRIWQVRSVAWSFVSVLPREVQEAYETIANKLERVL